MMSLCWDFVERGDENVGRGEDMNGGKGSVS